MFELICPLDWRETIYREIFCAQWPRRSALGTGTSSSGVRRGLISHTFALCGAWGMAILAPFWRKIQRRRARHRSSSRGCRLPVPPWSVCCRT